MFLEKSTIRSVCGWSFIFGLTACSDAAFDGYGPRGSGLVGGAYGYSERQISDDQFHVTYVEAAGYAQLARQNAQRRANELCVDAGYKRAEFDAQIINEGELVRAEGNAVCQASEEVSSTLTPKESAEARIEEIDAEIASLNSALQESYRGNAVLTDPLLGQIGNLTDRMARQNYESRIDTLRSEKAQLAAQYDLPVSSPVPSSGAQIASYPGGPAAADVEAAAQGLSCDAAQTLKPAGDGASVHSFCTAVLLKARRRELLQETTTSSWQASYDGAVNAYIQLSNGRLSRNACGG